MEVFFEVCPCKIIAVTGSDGKTTTTTLIAEILKHAGRRVWLGGNIGTPLLPVAEKMEPDDIAVVELSSFQLMGMTRSADVAVVTNLAPNHLDVHKDMAEYIAAKQTVYLHQSRTGKLVVNMAHAITDGSDSQGVAYILLQDQRTGKKYYGVGVSHNINLAPLRGILSAINRAVTAKQ